MNNRWRALTPGELAAELLRGHELEAYRTAFYLLQEEKRAGEAARRALLAVGKLPELPDWTAADRQAAVKQAVIRESLAIARDALRRRRPS